MPGLSGRRGIGQGEVLMVSHFVVYRAAAST